MSKDLPQQPQQSEEVDLGQLFKMIGNLFDRLFKFITGVFREAFNFVIILLVHFHRRKLWYIASISIGLVTGYFLDQESDKLYGANLFVETNFGSTRQVYENIHQFNQLTIDKDSLELANRLNITIKEASRLKGFYIKPDLDENTMAKMYSDFYLQLDSISRLDMSYKKYKESLTPFNFKVHQIGVAATDRVVYKKIEKNFVEQISRNAYLNKLLESNKAILNKKDQILQKQIQITDSLVGQYLDIRIKESQKAAIPNSGTNLYMGNAESTNLIVDESKIIKQRLSYENQRRKIDSILVTKNTIINVIADFPESGYDISEWHDKMKYLLPIVLFSILLLIFSVIGLGKFLDKQSGK
ncbi:hypothetical protein [Hyunsoonleella pacifica]|uniref:Uncharacterized protein n=1 Tax=Hyunsoonleella pacifica TaxID=1080224 RepID=A0A4Q9FPH0_9FLAO|nr:hypothetical protein [Hyunsoonleella pacifica]TBN16726.1 hypothetical protein EYD46_08840 [Hyunsoonleella pacifica]GGD16961.1 hypothetical protein GCM10011368_18670 [Hyunsoonleella pacifica]